VVRNMRMLWRRDNFWSLEVSPSNEVEDIRIGVGRGGIAMCSHRRLQHVIQNQGSLAGNRPQWIRFKRLEKVVPCMWNKIFQFLPTDCRWM